VRAQASQLQLAKRLHMTITAFIVFHSAAFAAPMAWIFWFGSLLGAAAIGLLAIITMNDGWWAYKSDCAELRISSIRLIQKMD